jgi:hypothetical protein
MTYHYYGVKGDFAWQLDWHNLWLPHKNTNSTHLPGLMRESDQVWVQGPRGGVQLIKGDYWDHWATYLRRDSEKMKQFTWVKLRARALQHT